MWKVQNYNNNQIMFNVKPLEIQTSQCNKCLCNNKCMAMVRSIHTNSKCNNSSFNNNTILSIRWDISNNRCNTRICSSFTTSSQWLLPKIWILEGWMRVTWLEDRGHHMRDQTHGLSRRTSLSNSNILKGFGWAKSKIRCSSKDANQELRFNQKISITVNQQNQGWEMCHHHKYNKNNVFSKQHQIQITQTLLIKRVKEWDSGLLILWLHTNTFQLILIWQVAIKWIRSKSRKCAKNDMPRSHTNTTTSAPRCMMTLSVSTKTLTTPIIQCLKSSSMTPNKSNTGTSLGKYSTRSMKPKTPSGTSTCTANPSTMP